MRVLLLLFFAFSVHAQSYQYRLEGTFTTNSTAAPVAPNGIAAPDTSMGSEPTSPTIVNYSVNWNETSTTIQGVYQDNYFSQGAPRQLSGSVTPNGRNMTVILPTTVSDVRQVSIVTNVGTTVTGSVPVAIKTQNTIGSTIDNTNSIALLTALPAASEGAGVDHDQDCLVGFGALSGMCGIYNGTFNEFSDTSQRCHLLSQGNPRLQFGTNTTFSFILNYIPGARTQTSHTIGSFLPSPQTNSINISGRNCSTLSGTNFPGADCKTLNLSGTFRPDATSNYGFVGIYQIVDEATGDSCSYELNLTRESAY